MRYGDANLTATDGKQLENDQCRNHAWESKYLVLAYVHSFLDPIQLGTTTVGLARSALGSGAGRLDRCAVAVNADNGGDIEIELVQASRAIL